MKRIIILMMLLFFVLTSFGQQIIPKHYWKETDYYKESKNLKKAGGILTGLGSAGLYLTYKLDVNYLSNSDDEVYFLFKSYFISGTCLIGGINSFIVSMKKKKKAKEASVSINRILQLELKYIYNPQK